MSESTSLWNSPAFALWMGEAIVKEAKVASEPEALVCFFKELGVPVNRIGLEAGPLSPWLHAGPTQAGFQTVLLETRHVKAALSAMSVKDGRQGCLWACTAAADGMVPAGARQIDWIAGDPGAAGRAQAASRKVAGRGIEHSGNPARFRPEGRPGDPQNV